MVAPARPSRPDVRCSASTVSANRDRFGRLVLALLREMNAESERLSWLTVFYVMSGDAAAATRTAAAAYLFNDVAMQCAYCLPREIA